MVKDCNSPKNSCMHGHSQKNTISKAAPDINTNNIIKKIQSLSKDGYIKNNGTKSSKWTPKASPTKGCAEKWWLQKNKLYEWLSNAENPRNN